jgi:hypothetical protein
MLGFEEEQFLKVFNNLARLDHPNIVRLAGYCYDVQNQYVEYKERLVFAERIIGRSALSICIMEALANIFLVQWNAVFFFDETGGVSPY